MDMADQQDRPEPDHTEDPRRARPAATRTPPAAEA